MNDSTNRIVKSASCWYAVPAKTKKFRIKRSNGKIVKGTVSQPRRAYKPHINPIHQFRPFFKVIYEVGGGDVMADLGIGTSLDQTLEAIKDIAFSDAVDGFMMECGDSVTFE